MDKKETKENKPVAKNTKVAEFAVALSYSPKLKDTRTIDTFGVFTLSAPLEQEVQITVGGTRGYGPGATVWVEFGGNYRIHAFFQSNGKEEYWMDVCVNRLTTEGLFAGVRG